MEFFFILWAALGDGFLDMIRCEPLEGGLEKDDEWEIVVGVRLIEEGQLGGEVVRH